MNNLYKPFCYHSLWLLLCLAPGLSYATDKQNPASQGNNSRTTIATDKLTPKWTPALEPDPTGEGYRETILSRYDTPADEKLFNAVLDGDSKQVHELLKDSATSVHARDGIRRTPVMIAAHRGYTDIVDMLLKAGADPNASDERTQTALNYAAMEGETAIIKLLIKARADVHYTDEQGKSPLIWSVISGSPATVKILLEEGADINHKDSNELTPLLYALRLPESKIAINLIEAGANINISMPKSRNNALILAAQQGDIGLVKLVLEKKVNLNSVNQGGNNALMMAISSRQYKAAKYLIDAGIDIKHQNRIGRTALHAAASKDTEGALTRQLIQRGAEIDLPDRNTSTPIKLASAFGNITAIDTLVESGVDLKAYDEKAMFTPLMSAAANQQPLAVKHLIQLGSDVNSQDSKGRSPLMWAAKYGCVNCVKVLLEKGAKLEIRDIRERTAMDYVLHESKNKQLIELLESAPASQTD